MASPDTDSPGVCGAPPLGVLAWTSDVQGSTEASRTVFLKQRPLYFSIVAKRANIYLPKIHF